MARTPVAYCYVRVSHAKGFATLESQLESDTSIKEQVARTVAYYEAYVKPLGVILWPDVLIEPRVSAREVPLRQRPKGRWLDEVLLPGDHVVFAYFDRSVRSLRDWANLLPDWQARGIRIHFVDLQLDLSSAHGQMVANVLASVAQWESDLKSLRAKSVKRWLREHGRALGGPPPLGFKVVGKRGDRRLEIDEDMLPILAEITRLRDEKGLTWEQISIDISRRISEWNGRRFFPARHPRLWPITKCRRAYRSYREICERFGRPAKTDTARAPWHSLPTDGPQWTQVPAGTQLTSIKEAAIDKSLAMD